MSYLQDALIRKQEELLTIINLTTDSTKNAPQGHLRISHSGKSVQYYYKFQEEGKVEKQNKAGRYMRKEERKLAYAIVQRDYDLKVLYAARKNLKAIQTFLKEYKTDGLQEIYEQVNPYRKEIIIPRIISDEEYIRRWQNEEYKGKIFAEGMAEIYTNKGERVRSKSEKIIADMLNRYEIPYRYEYPIYLHRLGQIYPDFTVLDVKKRKQIYWEHFGMMDNNDYCEKALHKLDIYMKNEILIGDTLIFTHETSKRPLETAVIDKLIHKYFM